MEPSSHENRDTGLGGQAPLVCIVGVPRSGTTWLWGLLTSHPDVAPLVWEDFDPSRPSVVDGRRLTSETGAFLLYDDAKVAEVVAAKARANPGKTLVEKTPNHIHHVGRIIRLFPRARVLHVLRDPRAVVSSMLHSRFFRFAESLEQATELYRSAMDAVAPWVSDPRVGTVTYEDLAAGPAATLAAVLAFLGLPDREIPRMIAENQGRAKVDRDGVFRKGRTDSYREDLAPEQIRQIELRLGPYMEALGYR